MVENPRDWKLLPCRNLAALPQPPLPKLEIMGGLLALYGVLASIIPIDEHWRWVAVVIAFILFVGYLFVVYRRDDVERERAENVERLRALMVRLALGGVDSLTAEERALVDVTSQVVQSTTFNSSLRDNLPGSWTVSAEVILAKRTKGELAKRGGKLADRLFRFAEQQQYAQYIIGQTLGDSITDTARVRRVARVEQRAIRTFDNSFRSDVEWFVQHMSDHGLDTVRLANLLRGGPQSFSEISEIAQLIRMGATMFLEASAS